MKIIKINENQICCTLTREDLANRQMRLSELAYGTEKAKNLFQEMIHQASFECGFEPEDFPIMIEAIPMPEESIVVLITKVEYPEELDARYSDFSAFDQEDAGFDEVYEDTEQLLPGADDIIDYFKHCREDAQAESKNDTVKESSTGDEAAANEATDMIRIFEFAEMSQVESLADLLGETYQGYNSLYRMDREMAYALVLHKGRHTPEEFNRISNLASEYGHANPWSSAADSHYREHGKLILEGAALQSLKKQLLIMS